MFRTIRRGALAALLLLAPVWPARSQQTALYPTETGPLALAHQVMLLDGAGRAVPWAAVTPAACTAACAALVLKASPGIFFGAAITAGATSGYAMLFNLTADPGDGAVTPLKCIATAAGQTVTISPDPGAPAWIMSVGVTLVFSSTGCFTKTESATAYMTGQAL